MSETQTETSEKNEKKKPGPKPKSALDKLMEQAGDLSEDEKEELRRIGVTFPSKISPKARKGDYTWGIRCIFCGEIAVFYIEDEWEIGGVTYSEPPPHVPIGQIAWTQDCPSQDINRHSPQCPRCSSEVAVNVIRGRKVFRHDRHRLVRIQEYNKARKVDVKRLLREAKAKERQALASGESPPSPGSPSYDLKGDKPSDYMPKEHIEAINYLDQRYDLAGNLQRILRKSRG